MKKILFTIICLQMSLLTFAIDKMSEATQFYSVGEYDKAIEIYNSLINEDFAAHCNAWIIIFRKVVTSPGVI